MKRLLYELTESWKIALAQMQANKTRSLLTALGVIIGIVAVTLMGTAITGISTGFDRSMVMLGEDVLYVNRQPWIPPENWWQFRGRKKIRTDYADRVNRLIKARPNSLLSIAVPVSTVLRNVKRADNIMKSVIVQGTNASFVAISPLECSEGRFFNEIEARSGTNVAVIGYDIATALFPTENPLKKSIEIGGVPFKIVGVAARQGSFLGLFSWDAMVAIPLPAFERSFSAKSESDVRVQVKDKTKMAEAKGELTGIMRQVRGLAPEKKDDFSINEQQAFKSTLDPVKNSIAIAGFFITGLALFVGAIGIMNITFVSVKERTKEIGTRKALGARRRTILLQFLIESTALCVLGGIFGLALAYVICAALGAAFPSFPIEFSMNLVLVSVGVSVATGLCAGLAPAWTASRLDPVTALRYE